MKFLVDNSISPVVADGLRRAGHDAVHISEYGMASAPDELVLERALAEERIAIAYDLDFSRIVALSQQSKPSLIIFRRLRYPPAQIAAILNNLRVLQIALDDGCIAVIEPDRIRVRDLPLAVRTSVDDD